MSSTSLHPSIVRTLFLPTMIAWTSQVFSTTSFLDVALSSAHQRYGPRCGWIECELMDKHSLFPPMRSRTQPTYTHSLSSHPPIQWLNSLNACLDLFGTPFDPIPRKRTSSTARTPLKTWMTIIRSLRSRRLFRQCQRCRTRSCARCRRIRRCFSYTASVDIFRVNHLQNQSEFMLQIYLPSS